MSIVYLRQGWVGGGEGENEYVKGRDEYSIPKVGMGRGGEGENEYENVRGEYGIPEVGMGRGGGKGKTSM